MHEGGAAGTAAAGAAVQVQAYAASRKRAVPLAAGAVEAPSYLDWGGQGRAGSRAFTEAVWLQKQEVKLASDKCPRLSFPTCSSLPPYLRTAAGGGGSNYCIGQGMGALMHPGLVQRARSARAEI